MLATAAPGFPLPGGILLVGMSIGSPADLRGMRAVGRVVAECLRELRAAVRPGMTTGELDAIAARHLRRRGARAAPAALLGFPASVCVSVDDEAVHGIPGKRRIDPGAVVKLDVTAELDGYIADSAITVLVPPVRPQAAQLAGCAQMALQGALGVARAGRPVSSIGRAVEREVAKQGFQVLRELRGHGTGRTIWEPPFIPNYFVPSSSRTVLREGLVLAVEPIISAGTDRVVDCPDRWTLRTSDGSLAAHVEHTIVVRDGRPLILTEM